MAAKRKVPKARTEAIKVPVPQTREQIEALTEGVKVWCEANRVELTKNDKTKTASFTTGEVRWRVTPPKVMIRGAEAVLDSLKRLGLDKFVRQKEEISKEAILADPDGVRGVAGISIQQTEELVVVPFETALEEVA
jgi:phage host-nuclease inhibitor protein Gam